MPSSTRRERTETSQGWIRLLLAAVLVAQGIVVMVLWLQVVVAVWNSRHDMLDPPGSEFARQTRALARAAIPGLLTRAILATVVLTLAIAAAVWAHFTWGPARPNSSSCGPVPGEVSVRGNARTGGLIAVGLVQAATFLRVMWQLAGTYLVSRFGYSVPHEAVTRLAVLIGLSALGILAWVLMYRAVTRGQLLVAAMAACALAGGVWWLLP